MTYLTWQFPSCIGSYEVEFSLSKWPWADHQCQWFVRELWDGGKPLTFVTFLGEGLGIGVDKGTEISMLNNLVGERFSTRVVFHKCLHGPPKGPSCLLLG